MLRRICVRWLIAELLRRDRVLATTGLVVAAQGVVLLVLMPFDDQTILGVDRWLKPFKFCVSVTIFLWTVAWLLPHLPAGRALRSRIRWSIALVQVGEIAGFVMQSARGTRSHYNYDTLFDASVFWAMGGLIALNTIVLALMLYLFCARSTPTPVSRPYVWGIRLGILVFLLGSAVGSVMIQHGAHTVGAPDGGPGLPLVNWSTEAGDLRAAHMVGLHALQVVPLVGFLAGQRDRRRATTGGVRLVLAFAACYVLVGAVLFWRALSGDPVLAWI